jgi:hypothetical protein
MLVGFDPQSQYISESPYKHTAQYKDNANTRNRGRGSRTQPIMSMAPSSSLRAVALVPSHLPSGRQSRVAVPSSSAGRRRGKVAGLVALAAALPSDAQWLERLPEKKKPLYTHSLPCIEAWLRNIGFAQAREDPSVWVAEMPLWHARLSLDVTDVHIRYACCLASAFNSIRAPSLTKTSAVVSLLNKLV